ncbi:hypothetical protein L6164_023990 [Bauhinia variegata]|uniref:Uncharacterized protein n=1 Tax=Bauhinia variegata TaxID=167791 RepID=A0ACB9LW45_BAUVA|nr:hypothetical protein L6164_023990 [Bauhinia variegata]
MDEFLLQLNCPKLECVIIKTNFENEVEAPYDFFGGMEELRVLVMFNEGTKFPIPKLLKSIESLTNLRCLMLRELELGDVPFLGSFSTIEDLSIGCCSFHELPIGVVNLKNLRLMELEECQIEKNPCDVIKRCSRLEELYFVGNEYPKYKGESSLECSKFKLQRYHIEIGTRIKEFNYNDYSIKRYLSIESFDNHFSDATFVDLIRRAEVLYLGEIHGGCKNIIPDFVHKIGDGMNELTKLLVRDSDEVECLVDMTNSFHHIGMVFSNLTYLEISGMEHLEELFLGKPHHGLLQKLEELHISKCNLKHIIANEPEIISDGRIPRSYDSVFPKLKVISIKECQELEYLMPVSFAKSQLQLENVEIDSASQLKYVFGQPNLDDEGLSCNLNQNEFHMVKLEALKSLTLRDIPNIVSICPENYHAI